MVYATYEAVAEAATTLLSQDKEPTLNDIRDVLGGGSLNTIAKHLRTFREGRGEAEARLPPTFVNEFSVAAAAENLLLGGKKPTIEAVRKELGTGSKRTISPLLEKWHARTNRAAKRAALEVPKELRESSTQLIGRLWCLALEHVRDRDEATRRSLGYAERDLKEARRAHNKFVKDTEREIGLRDAYIADLEKRLEMKEKT
ncbi:hypothetical protein LCGC14_0043860 [marine sediment metagenome]|uniref:KfrA N-terminal DNA-binding domain-containing protein n=2 Tax=root TaxID=1 RepID=A0A7V1BHP8_9RHOB|nr:DNA-binding protein [Sulfitobacter litoralis]HDZ53441.1 hypothetical protein [Sulfitobacter litoralis]